MSQMDADRIAAFNVWLHACHLRTSSKSAVKNSLIQNCAERPSKTPGEQMRTVVRRETRCFWKSQCEDLLATQKVRKAPGKS
jgi:hypothetical protein